MLVVQGPQTRCPVRRLTSLRSNDLAATSPSCERLRNHLYLI